MVKIEAVSDTLRESFASLIHFEGYKYNAGKHCKNSNDEQNFDQSKRCLLVHHALISYIIAIIEVKIMQEYETRFIDINIENIETKLEILGATKRSDLILEEWVFKKPEWKDVHGRIRIRRQGNEIKIAYKETLQDTSKGNTEIEFNVEDVQSARDFILKTTGAKQVRHQQKRRISYHWKNNVIDIDLWPLIPPMVELEGAGPDDLKQLCVKLDLNWDKRIELDVLQIYEQIYKIDLSQRSELLFD